jgi:uncharacterized protein (TIGR03578 family)
MSSSHFKTETFAYNVSGSGETEAEAVEETFKNMRQEIGANFKKPVIAIRTVDYTVNTIQKEEKEEAYLYVFMKRTRIKFSLDVTITVEIDFVELEGGK